MVPAANGIITKNMRTRIKHWIKLKLVIEYQKHFYVHWIQKGLERIHPVLNWNKLRHSAMFPLHVLVLCLLTLPAAVLVQAEIGKFISFCYKECILLLFRRYSSLYTVRLCIVYVVAFVIQQGNTLISNIQSAA